MWQISRNNMNEAYKLYTYSVCFGKSLDVFGLMLYFAQISFLLKDFLYFCNVMMKIWYKVLIWFICIWWVSDKKILWVQDSATPLQAASPIHLSPYQWAPSTSYSEPRPTPLQHSPSYIVTLTAPTLPFTKVTVFSPTIQSHSSLLPPDSTSNLFPHCNLSATFPFSPIPLIITTSGQPYP